MPLARFSLAALAALIAFAVVAVPAQATDFDVNLTSDVGDASTGDTLCDSDAGQPGLQCTLRAAVEEAANDINVGLSSVNVPPGTYDLSLGPLTPALTTSIVGTSTRTTVIRQTGIERVFDISFGTIVIRAVTVTGGTANASNGFFGGNIRAQNANVTISNSAITDGSASSGGGISNIFGDLLIRGTTVADNAADTGGGDGGAVQNFGNVDNVASLTVENSTISGNRARLAGGIISGGNDGNSVTIGNSTITGNASNLPPVRGGGGGLFVASGDASVENSIVAQNVSASAGQQNCSVDSAATITSLGFNIESGSECGFTAPGDQQNTNPLLAPLQDAGGPNDTHPLIAGSPAIDAGNAETCEGTDQRGVTRPQGPGCDIGAFELVPAIVAQASPDTVIVSGPSVLTTDRTPTFTFGSSQPGTTFECSIDGGPFVPCASPFTPPAALVAGTHTFRVRARDAAGNLDPTPAALTFAIPAQLSDLPPPIIGKVVNAEPVSGEVTVAIPPGAGSARGGAQASQKGLDFIPLREARQLPVGTFFDTKKGRVRLQTATTTPGRRQAGTFFSGLFQTLQSRARSAKGIFELRLKGSSFNSCRSAGHGKKGSAARHSKRRVRRLRGNAKGRFRTRGRYSAATVRGTVWDVSDRCDGTLTKVTRGKVAVRDLRRRKTILVRAGKSYLARARR